MDRELREPLMIREKLEDPLALVYAHQQLAINLQVHPNYIERQAQAIAHFEDMERLLGDN